MINLNLKTLKKLQFWALQILIAFDQFINAILRGWADETFSARCYRVGSKGKIHFQIMRFLVDGIFFWTDEHCRKSYQAELQREQMPREARLNNDET